MIPGQPEKVNKRKDSIFPASVSEELRSGKASTFTREKFSDSAQECVMVRDVVGRITATCTTEQWMDWLETHPEDKKYPV